MGRLVLISNNIIVNHYIDKKKKSSLLCESLEFKHNNICLLYRILICFGRFYLKPSLFITYYFMFFDTHNDCIVNFQSYLFLTMELNGSYLTRIFITLSASLIVFRICILLFCTRTSS